MIENEADDYCEWLKHRRVTSGNENLADRIMDAVKNPAAELPESASATRLPCPSQKRGLDGRDWTSMAMEAPGFRQSPPTPATPAFSCDKTQIPGILERVGPALLVTAASLVFMAKITFLIGNLVFPTQSYPEIAVDQRIEELTDEHHNVSRS